MRLTALAAHAQAQACTAPGAGGRTAGRFLGVLGGMGPLASSTFMVRLSRLTPARRDQDHIPVVLWSDPRVPDRSQALLAHSALPLSWMLKGVRKLEEAGAQALVIPCNTAHLWYDELCAYSQLPILHIADAVIGALWRQSVPSGPLGLLATRASLQLELYQSRMQAHAYAPVVLSDADFQAWCEPAITLVKENRLHEANQLLREAVRRLEARGVRAIVLACTELPLAFPHGQRPQCRVPVIDSIDALALADLGTFSRAANERLVSQPAFSRRIRALEDWFDVTLVDRTHQPVCLTPLAERHLPELRSLLNDINHLRARMQMEARGVTRLVLTTQHSLTMTRLPGLLRLIGQYAPSKIDFVVRSENRDECIAEFMRGHADLLLCIEQGHDPLLNLIPKAARLILGPEDLIPVSMPGPDQQPLFGYEGQKHLKILAYPAQSFMGRVTESPMRQVMLHHDVEVIHESIFLAGVKEMVKTGLGMAWLPSGLVSPDIQAGHLIDLSNRFPVVRMQLNLYCHLHGPHTQAIQEIYSLLQTHSLLTHP